MEYKEINMKRIHNVKELIEILEQFPEDAHVTMHQGFKIVPTEIVYLQKRNILVFQEHKEEEKNNE